MTYPSHIARTALRKALREHPDSETVLKGRLVSSLTLDQIKDALGTLGLSHSQIVLIALHGQAAIDRAMTAQQACDNSPQDEPPMIAEAEYEAELKADEAEVDAIEDELRTLRQLVGTGGFAALDDRLRELVTEARKPPVEDTVESPGNRYGPRTGNPCRQANR